MSDAEAIRALIDERIDAVRNKDAARAIVTLAPDMVAFELAPPLRLGPEGARDAGGLQGWFDMWDGPIEIDYRDLVVECGGDIALAHSLNRMRGTRRDGQQVDFWMRSTLGFRRIDGAWKISHGHTSVPFYMDGSFRAARDLQP
jgi:ketosteroid isomerase-like protein